MERYLNDKCILICVSQEFLRKFQVDEAELEASPDFRSRSKALRSALP